MAVEDAFLADAMEGYRQFPEADHEATLGRLKDKLAQKTGKKRPVVPFFRIAAAVAMIIIAGGIIWTVNNNYSLKENTVAMDTSSSENEEAADKSITPGPEKKKSIATEKNNNSKQEFPTPVPPPPTMQEIKIDRPAEDALKDMDVVTVAGNRELNNTPPRPNLILDDIGLQQADEIIEVAEDDVVEEKIAAEPAITAPEELTYTFEDMDAELRMDSLNVVIPEEQKYIVGTILARDKHPLIGVNVIASGTPVSTLTNGKGEFKLEWQPEIQALEFDYAGYEKTIARVQGPGSLNVTMDLLDENLLSKEIAEAEPAAKKAQTRRRFIGQQKVFPVGGFSQLETYIDNNKKTDKQGEVLLQFIVNTDGSLTNMKSLQASDQSLEQEAIKLLSTGPAWENKTGIAQITEYVVKFK